MATQQDIFAVGSKNHPLMLSKEDYVQWSSRIICYYKSKPDGKLLAKSILEEVEERTLVPAPYDLLANTQQKTTYPSPVYTTEQPLPLNNNIVQQPSPNNNNNFLQQQPFPFDTIIDVNDPIQAMQIAFALMPTAFTRRYYTPTNNNQRISSNTHNKQIAQPWMNMNQGR
ncbi:hypothetical protein Tco_0738822 [Tanacetum coccineum]